MELKKTMLSVCQGYTCIVLPVYFDLALEAWDLWDLEGGTENERPTRKGNFQPKYNIRAGTT